MNARDRGRKAAGDSADGREQREARRGPGDRDRHARHQLSAIAVTPMAMPSTTSPEAICVTDAPTAASPWITTATELA